MMCPKRSGECRGKWRDVGLQTRGMEESRDDKKRAIRTALKNGSNFPTRTRPLTPRATALGGHKAQGPVSGKYRPYLSLMAVITAHHPHGPVQGVLHLTLLAGP